MASDPTVAALAGLPPPPDLAGQPPNDVGASLLPSFLDPSAQLEPGRDYAFSEYPQCPGEHPGHLGQATVGGFGNYWHTDRGCQGIFRENISFFGFSIRSLAYRYTEVSTTAYKRCFSLGCESSRCHGAALQWRRWLGTHADWEKVVGVELYDYRQVDMSEFSQFDRVNVAGQLGHAAAQKELAAALRAHFDRM